MSKIKFQVPKISCYFVLENFKDLLIFFVGLTQANINLEKSFILYSNIF